MRLRLGMAALCLIALAGALPVAAQTGAECGVSVLYDAALGKAPAAQGLQFLALGAAVTQTVGSGATTLDTSAAANAQAGYISSVQTLNRSRGYTLTLVAELAQEAHTSQHRAGFSVIALSSDLRGVELGFWPERVWAQAGGSPPALFTQAEGVALTTGQLSTYTLRIAANSYVLSQDGAAVLTGTLRSYTAFSGFPDPYETPNFIFLGDNTSSARAIVRLSRVALDRGPCTSRLPVVLAKATVTRAATPSIAVKSKTIAIKGFQFGPRTLEIAAGTSVTWANGDDAEHTITSGAPGALTKRFDGLVSGKGDRYAFTFDKPGTFTYFCERHSGMTGKIIVK
jgi:plastocyanin